MLAATGRGDQSSASANNRNWHRRPVCKECPSLNKLNLAIDQVASERRSGPSRALTQVKNRLHKRPGAAADDARSRGPFMNLSQFEAVPTGARSPKTLRHGSKTQARWGPPERGGAMQLHSARRRGTQRQFARHARSLAAAAGDGLGADGPTAAVIFCSLGENYRRRYFFN